MEESVDLSLSLALETYIRFFTTLLDVQPWYSRTSVSNLVHFFDAFKRRIGYDNLITVKGCSQISGRGRAPGAGFPVAAVVVAAYPTCSAVIPNIRLTLLTESSSMIKDKRAFAQRAADNVVIFVGKWLAKFF